MRCHPSGFTNTSRRFNVKPLRKRQLGQAAVFVYVFLAVLIVAMSSLYKAGKLTSDKMELQNAADAAAYSVSVVEARDLNFASYMNRAIVANEVAIGQLVGVASWAYHWRSFHDYLSLYSSPLKAAPLTPLGLAFEGLAKTFKASGEPLSRAMKVLANIGGRIIHFINWLYGGSEYAFHLASTVYVLGALEEMIDQNAPNGARLSEYGLLALIGHLATYGAIPSLPGEKFTRSYNPRERVDFEDFIDDGSGATAAGGYGRLAALIHGSADPFINQRGWVFDFFKELNKVTPFPSFLYSERDGQGWLGPDVGDTWSLGIADIRWRIWLQIHIDLTRAGGSELRLLVPIGGADKDKAAGQFFNWSAADTTNLGLGLDGGFYVDGRACLPLIACTDWGRVVGGQILAVNDRLLVEFTFIGIDVTLLDTPFPTKVPFGAAFAQAGKPGNFIASRKEQIGSENSLTPALEGPVPIDAYGGAANSLLAWEFPTPPGIFFQAGKAERRVNQSYGGLPTYVDTAKDSAPLQGSGGPNLVVGVVLEEREFDLGNPVPGGGPPQPEVEPVGRFQITEKMASDQLHVLAKSEVYFKRPSDLSYYLRQDGQEEYGSAFNPYWNARLVETSHADRAAALKLQQDIDMEGSGKPFDISSLFAPIINLLGL